jgi:hypothetical protein
MPFTAFACILDNGFHLFSPSTAMPQVSVVTCPLTFHVVGYSCETVGNLLECGLLLSSAPTLGFLFWAGELLKQTIVIFQFAFTSILNTSFTRITLVELQKKPIRLTRHAVQRAIKHEIPPELVEEIIWTGKRQIEGKTKTRYVLRAKGEVWVAICNEDPDEIIVITFTKGGGEK